MKPKLLLTVSLLRQHRSGYVAFAALLVLAGVLSAAELVLILALGTGVGIEWSDYSVVEQAVMRNALERSAGLFQFMCGITIVVSLILVFFGFRSMMSSRQRELGQMRLLGASPAQLRMMVVAEACTFALVILIPSITLGWLCANPLFAGLKQLGVFRKSISLDMGLPLLPLFGLLILLVSCTMLAGWLSVRPRETRNVLEAVQFTPASSTRQRMGRRRIVLASASVVILLASMVFTPRDDNANPIISLLLPVLIVFPLATLAPLLIPPVARLIAYALSPVARGLSLLVAQRASRDAVRFSSNVLPILIGMGVMVGVAIGNGPDNANLREQIGSEFEAPFVAQSENSRSINVVAESVRQIYGQESATRFASTTLLLDESKAMAGSDGTLTVFNFTDLDNLTRFFRLDVTDGALGELKPNETISAREGDAPGDVVEISNGEGKAVKLTIVAVVAEDMFFTDLVMDWSILEQLKPDVQDSGVLLSTEAAEAAQRSIPENTALVSKAEFVQQQVEKRESNAAMGNIALFGTTYMIAGVALVQGLASSVLKRKQEFHALRQLGASRLQIVLQLLVEATVLTLSTALLLLVASAFMIWRFFSERSETIIQLAAQVSWDQLLSSYAIVLSLFVVTAVLAGVSATRRGRD